MSQKRISVIEFTDSHLKLLEGVRVKNALNITCLEPVFISGMTDREISGTLKQAVAKSPKARFKQFTVIIPRSCVTIQYVLLPTHNHSEIRNMLEFQVAGLTPYEKRDVLFDYMILEDPPAGRPRKGPEGLVRGRQELPAGHIRVLLVIAHRDVVGRYLVILKEAGLVPYMLTISSAGLLKWLMKSGHAIKYNNGFPKVLINLDDSHCEVCFCYRENLLFSRSIPFEAKAIGKDNDAHFMNQMDSTFDVYHNESENKKADQMILLSSLKDTGIMQEKLRQRYNVQVDVFNPAAELISGNREGLENLSYAAALGFIFDQQASIDLLPAEIKEHHRQEVRKHKRNRLGILFFLVFLLCGMIPGVGIIKQKAYLNRLHETLETLRPGATEAQSAVSLFKFLEDELTSKIFVSEVLHELYRLTPEDVSFDSLSLGDKKRLVLEGLSYTDTDVNRFHEAMVSSGFFTDVNLEYVKKREKKDGKLIQFQVNCAIASRKNPKAGQ